MRFYRRTLCSPMSPRDRWPRRRTLQERLGLTMTLKSVYRWGQCVCVCVCVCTHVRAYVCACLHVYLFTNTLYVTVYRLSNYFNCLMKLNLGIS